MGACKCVLKDRDELAKIAETMVSMFDREVFDYVLAADTAGAVLGSAVAIRLKRGVVFPDSEIPAGRYVVIGFELTDGEELKTVTDKIKEKGGNIIKMGFFSEDRSFNARRKLFRGVPIESANIF